MSQPPGTPRYMVDQKLELPKEYFAFNPQMLDSEQWTYRDLQKLAMKLHLSGRGTREQLIERLREWHTKQFCPDRRCTGSNFNLIEVTLPGTPPPAAPSAAGAAAPEEAKERPAGGVSPSLLSPLKTKPRRNADGSPVSILRHAARSSEKKRLNFSIFNQVKIIPPREALQRKWAREDGLNFDDHSDSSDDEDAVAAAPGTPSSSSSRAPVSYMTPAKDEVDDWLRSDTPGDVPKPSPAASRVSSVYGLDDSDDEDAASVRCVLPMPSPSPARPIPMQQAAFAPALQAQHQPLASASGFAPARPLAPVSPARSAAQPLSSSSSSGVLSYANNLLRQAAKSVLKTAGDSGSAQQQAADAYTRENEAGLRNFSM